MHACSRPRVMKGLPADAAWVACSWQVWQKLFVYDTEKLPTEVLLHVAALDRAGDMPERSTGYNGSATIWGHRWRPRATSDFPPQSNAGDSSCREGSKGGEALRLGIIHVRTHDDKHSTSRPPAAWSREDQAPRIPHTLIAGILPPLPYHLRHPS